MTRSRSETARSNADLAVFLAADEPAGVEAAYTPTAMARLRAVKDRYDPHNIFRINNNITPTVRADSRRRLVCPLSVIERARC